MADQVFILNLSETSVVSGRFPAQTKDKFVEQSFVLVGGQINAIPSLVYEEKLKGKAGHILLSEKEAEDLLASAKKNQMNPAGFYTIGLMEKQRLDAEEAQRLIDEEVKEDG